MIYLTAMPQPHSRGRRVRASKPKVRTGCITCKLRRVKCDEAKPYCLRCQKFGVLCEGYAPIPPKGNSTSGTNSSASTPPSDLDKALKQSDIGDLAACFPSFHLFEDNKQLLYFQFFCDRTSHSLSGFYDADLWGRLILQACHQEEFVRHAVIALGALDQTMDIAQQFKQEMVITGVDIATSIDSTKQRVLTHHEYALQHYNKSIALMRQGLNDDYTNEHQLRNILISCLLIVCFEIFHGNMNAALFQAQIGINLLSEWLRKCPLEGRGLAIAGLRSPKPHIIEDELIQAFARLERQCMTFLTLDLDRSREVVRECFHSFKNIPERFSSLKEARAYFFLLDRFSSHSTVLAQSRIDQNAIYSAVAYRRFAQVGTKRMETSMPNHVSNNGPMPDIIRQGLKAHHAAFTRWIHAFEPILQGSKTQEGSDDYLGALILHMRSKVNVLSNLRTFTDETTFHERYLPDFIEIVTLSKEVLELSSQSQSARRTRFMFDANIIGMLFFLTNFVRHRLVRRQAVELLEAYPGREGAWDSAMAARLARWNIQMEEDGLSDDVVYVPESKKVHMLNLESSLADRKMILDYYIPSQANGHEQKVSRQELTW